MITNVFVDLPRILHYRRSTDFFIFNYWGYLVLYHKKLSHASACSPKNFFAVVMAICLTVCQNLLFFGGSVFFDKFTVQQIYLGIRQSLPLFGQNRLCFFNCVADNKDFIAVSVCFVFLIFSGNISRIQFFIENLQIVAALFLQKAFTFGYLRQFIFDIRRQGCCQNGKFAAHFHNFLQSADNIRQQKPERTA